MRGMSNHHHRDPYFVPLLSSLFFCSKASAFASVPGVVSAGILACVSALGGELDGIHLSCFTMGCSRCCLMRDFVSYLELLVCMPICCLLPAVIVLRFRSGSGSTANCQLPTANCQCPHNEQWRQSKRRFLHKVVLVEGIPRTVTSGQSSISMSSKACLLHLKMKHSQRQLMVLNLN
jgi:hypothetical protein